MNALVSIDVATLTPATVFVPGGVEAIVSKIEAEVSAEVFTIDTQEGRERIKSVAYKVARSKTALDEMGKELVAGIKAQAGAIDADRRTIRDRLDALKERVRGPLTVWETAEVTRVSMHEDALVWIAECTRFAAPPTAAEVKQRIGQLAYILGRDWQEFAERASAAGCDAIPALDAMFTEAGKREADAAELAELRRLKAERDEADRIAAAAAQAAEKARQEAEQKAARDAAEAEQRAEWQRKREEQAERDVQAAVARAIEADRRIQEENARAAAAKKAAEEAAERKRQENKRYRAKINNQICADLIAAGVPNDVELVQAIVKAIAAGSVRHLSINY